MIIEFVIAFIFLTLTVSGLVGGFLYSELISGFRNKWIKHWSKTKYFSKLQYYGICSLCLGVPTSLLLEWLFLPWMSLIYYILFAVASSMASAILVGLWQALVYIKYSCEIYTKYRELEFKRRNVN